MSTMRFVPCALILAAVACAPPKVDTTAETQKLLARDKEWSALAAAGQNEDTVASYFSEDAALIPNGQPTIDGRAALKQYLGMNFKKPGFKIQWTAEKAAMSPDGKMAYIRESTTLSTPGPQGTAVTVNMHGVTIWRVDADGQWRCALYMMSVGAPN